MISNLFRYFGYRLPYLILAILLRPLINLPRREFRKRTTIWHEGGVVLFWFYLIVVCTITLNLHSFRLDTVRASHEYNLVPFAGLSILWNSPDRQHAFVNIFGNIAMFAPLGFLLPLLWKTWSGVKVFLMATILSALIETIQFFTGRGTDIDDVILNALGAIFGYFLFRILKRLASRPLSAFRIKR